MDTIPTHYGLGELIARLREEPDLARRVKVGFRHPHSYRGYYDEVAFELAEDVSVGEMLTAAESALDSTYQGWKGGDYTMSKYTGTWLVRQEGECGETLGAVLLSLMLDEPAEYLRGCPVEVWDGPYLMRCSMGGDGLVCAAHGPFELAERCTEAPGCKRPADHGGRCG